MQLPIDYTERVYAGVLGKLIGVYLGRPIEGWTYDQIMAMHGEVDHYLPGRDGAPLVVTDDDITGTFTFLRALADNGYPADLTPQQIANGWLNYTVEQRTIFWWGGVGNSSEHTAYVRLKNGVAAPESGSRARNGKVISEQIGAQIFIDGWGMVAPGDPELAADLARRAASVSHDGEAIYGAQVIAAMEAQAFVEQDINGLLDCAVGLIPADSDIAAVIDSVRGWHAKESDWRKTRALIVQHFGYDKFVGPCHMVPNHALIIHALLYGEDDFRRSLMIVNTSGWDTDCNSGNVGCLLAIKNGLKTLEGDYDWRGPIADRLYLPTADGGRAITDAVIETFHVVNTARGMRELAPLSPKGGSRFHFELQGSVQGFTCTDAGVRLRNVVGHSSAGSRSLEINLTGDSGHPRMILTPTFIPAEAIAVPGYELLASPTIYPGQTITAQLAADESNHGSIPVSLAVQIYDGDDIPQTLVSTPVDLNAGKTRILTWTVLETSGLPLFAVGLHAGDDSGTFYLDYLDWNGEPDVVLARPPGNGTMWRRAWVDAVDSFDPRSPDAYRIVQNSGTGLLSQGTVEWRNYRAESPIAINLARSAGLAVRVQGLRRYYALVLCDDGFARLVKARDTITVLAEQAFSWETFQTYDLAVELEGNTITAWIDGVEQFSVEDRIDPLSGGGVALLVEEGCLCSDVVRVLPLDVT